MNASELASKMLEWERVKRQLDDITEEIQATVLEIGKTQTVGNVRATYSAGRKTYDYQGASEGSPIVNEAVKEMFSKRLIDWKAVCEHAGIEDVPFEQGAPSVTVKLM
jgi:hypothetical protein